MRVCAYPAPLSPSAQRPPPVALDGRPRTRELRFNPSPANAAGQEEPEEARGAHVRSAVDQVLSERRPPGRPARDLFCAKRAGESGGAFWRQARAPIHGQARLLCRARHACEPRRGRFPEARRQARRARRALSAEHAPLRDRFLRRPESRRNGRQLFAARRSSRARIQGPQQRDRHSRHRQPRLDLSSG